MLIISYECNQRLRRMLVLMFTTGNHSNYYGYRAIALEKL